ncbi:MAG: nitroreductase family deazaflavin-dependent oxidoreductase [Myxococcales bacterium]|nr:nitroreductase family deazaflavin-dependent oxidoreductase [Myxococcales bacterium]
MNPILKSFVGLHVKLYRATSGKFGGSMAGGKVLLLTTKGNKSGKERTVPVMFFEIDGRRFVIASYGGSPAHPAWFKNMQASPDVTVQVRERCYPARPDVITGDERARVWKHVIGQMPRFDAYEKKVGGVREIPVVELKETPAS